MTRAASLSRSGCGARGASAWVMLACLGVALGHRGREALDRASVHALLAEVLAGDVDVGALARAAEGYVGTLAVGLPAAGEHVARARRQALGLVDVLRVARGAGRRTPLVSSFTSRSLAPRVWIVSLPSLLACGDRAEGAVLDALLARADSRAAVKITSSPAARP